ncbi:MAG: glycosyltransferase family 39 protein [Chloroflexi bacterium]|nr:glycosyltransferase family 39 protein [Chloroflexota bacterium]
MNRKTTWLVLIVILLAAFFLYQYQLLEFPYYGDEVDGGDVTAKILQGQLVPFFPDGDGHEALYNFSMAPFFIVLGESEIASRWTSVAWTMVTVALMYVYGQRLFQSRRVGVMSAGLFAGLFWSAMFAHLSLRVVTLSAITIPALIGLVLSVRSRSNQSTLKAGVVGGIFAGLAAYTYTSGRGFPVIVAVFLVYLVIIQRELLFKHWRTMLVYIALMGVVSLWLYIYLRAHPEFDLRIREMAQLSWFFRGEWSNAPQALLETVAMFTVRGEPNWVNNLSERPVFVGPEGILFYLGVLLCVARLKKPEYGLQLIVVAAHLVPSFITEHPPSWGRSLGMMPALIVITVLPIEWAWKKLEAMKNDRRARLLNMRLVLSTYAVVVGVLGISIYARTAFDLFQVWMKAPGVYWMSLAFYDGAAKYVNQSSDTTPFNYIFDVYTPWRKTNIQRPIQRREVALRWSVLDAIVFPDDPRGSRIAFQILGAPVRPLLDAFVDLDAPIHIDPRVDSEGRRLLRVYAIPRARLDARLSRARVGTIFLPNTNTPITTSVRAGDALEFVGYEILNVNARPGDDLNVLTYWRVLQRPPNIAAFVHLLDAEQRVVAQFDGFGAVTDDLAPGDVVAQLHALKLPADLRAGAYRFALGVYTRDDLQRLPLSVGTDSVWLATWQLALP